MKSKKYRKKLKKSPFSLLLTLGNIINFPIGILQSITWFLWGVICYMTIIGVPFGQQCFKMGKLVLWPFGKKVIYKKTKSSNIILNLVWLMFNFWEPIFHFLAGLFGIASPILYWSFIGVHVQKNYPELYPVIGIYLILYVPFAIQQFKFGKLALFPFGAQVKNR